MLVLIILAWIMVALHAPTWIWVIWTIALIAKLALFLIRIIPD
jgi:hypothetical protein